MQRTFLLLALAPVLGALAPLPAQDLLISAGRIVIAPATALAPGRLLVRDGKVLHVGDEIPAEALQNARRVAFGDDAVITPGFVLAAATLGQDADLAERAFAFTPDLLAADAFDPWHEDLATLPGLGITSVALSPSPLNLAGGIAALAKPGRAKNGEPQGRIADRELHLQLSLSRAARDQQRAPTSLIGALDMLRTAFTDARQGIQGGPEIAILNQVIGGSRRVFAFADTYTELSGVLDLAQEFGFEPVIVGGIEAAKVLPRLIAQKAAIVLPTLSPEQRLAELELPAALAQAGVPFCFGGDPRQLRLSAALAVRHGLDRDVALQALTRTPALLLGLEDGVGSLRRGRAADFAVWRGHPLDLSSSHLATFVDGRQLAGDSAANDTSGER